MTGRTRKTPEQMIAGLERKLQAVKSKAKNMERAKQTRRAIILGQTIQSMAESGDANAKATLAKVIASLTRKQDRIAFDLEPLPDAGPDNQPSVNQPAPDVLAVALSARKQAIEGWKNDRSNAQKSLVSDAMAAVEKLTGKPWAELPAVEREFWGLTDRLGEVVRRP